VAAYHRPQRIDFVTSNGQLLALAGTGTVAEAEHDGGCRNETLIRRFIWRSTIYVW
jgi:hypothetical protein